MPRTVHTTLLAQSLPRTDLLKQHLLERQRALRHPVHHLTRDGLARASREGADDLGHSEADIHNLALALRQMQSEAFVQLVQIDAALTCLEAGVYGFCVDCEHPIATSRLRALPFTGRCQACAATREAARRKARLAQVRGRPARFSGLTAS
jgi:DnaK suppressor protein